MTHVPQWWRRAPDVMASFAGSVVRLDDRRRPPFKKFCKLDANGRLKFQPPLLGAYIIEQTPVAAGGGLLYVYQDGVYREGEQALRHLITDLLGNEWTRSRSEETIAWLRARAAAVDESPSPDEVNVRNGVLHIGRRGIELGDHDADRRTPVQLPVTYDPAASCPQIERFLFEVFPDPALLKLVYEIAGYLLVPDNSYQKAILLHGPGGNGKSRVLALLTALIGAENTSSRQLQDLDENRFACADLYGKLANICADISSRELQSSSKFKAITGGDRISGERKHQPAFEFTPFARLLFSANEVPSVRDGSKAFFDRWIVLPCTQELRGSEREDPKILDKLLTPAELSGFLNLALEGLLRLRRNNGRFSMPTVAAAAGWNFRRLADNVAGFVDAYPPKPRRWIKRADLYWKYQSWCHEVGLKPLSRGRFYARYAELVPLAEKKRRGHDGFLFLPPKGGQ